MSLRTVADVLARVGEAAPWDKAAGWDPVGLQLGDPAAPVARAAVCHEVTEDVVAVAVDGSVDLLVSYHPLLFRPTNVLTAGASAAGRALRLAAAGVAVAVAHTNFDVAPGGTADALAEALDLSAVTGFGPLWGAGSVKVVTYVPDTHADAVAAAMTRAGAGTIGNYRGCSFRIDGTGTFVPGDAARPAAGSVGILNRESEVRIEMNAPNGRLEAVVAALVAAHPYEEPAYDLVERRGDAGFVGRVGTIGPSTTLRTLAARVTGRCGGVVRIAGDPDRPIATVAVVPGSGGDFVDAAAGIADALVTGDIGHHRARRALDRGLSVVDPGHAPTERPGVRALYAAVAAAGTEVADFTGRDDSPWYEGGPWTS